MVPADDKTNLNNVKNDFNRHFVSCQIYGQIGNQLFTTATTLAYAWDYNAVPIFPGLSTGISRTTFNRDRLFFRLDHSWSPRPFRRCFAEKQWYVWEKIPFFPDLLLNGYFQSWKYFHHHRNRLLSVYAPSETTLKILNEKYAHLISSPKTVGVHVRTSGKLMHDQGIQPFLGLKYYDQAMSLFPDDSIFVLCSDRINWCKKHFPKLNRNIVFIEGNDPIEDLFLLTMMQHIIMGNSTFSWWGAYLNQNPVRKVVIPEFWGGNPPAPLAPKDLYFPDWTILPVPSFEPYPEDMYHYGETQSCDGNW